jgi:hypothetical protein
MLKAQKCDQRKPSCSQCIRGDRECSGYRDVADFIFLDQNKAIIKKVKKQSSSAISPVDSAVQLVPFTPAPLHLLALQPSVDDRAMGLFLSSFVLGKSRSFEYLDKFYAMPIMDDHLTACIKAVSLASFAVEVQSSDVLKQARFGYSAGLQLTNLALKSSKVAVKDSTLLAILLLHNFEKITAGHKMRPLASITAHIIGASALVHLRGQKQFNSPIGLRMFAQLSSILFISCAQCSVRVPAGVIALRDQYKLYLDAADPGWLVSEAMVQYVGLRADISEGILSQPAEIIAEAKRQDDLCKSLSETIALRWPYETYFTGDTESAFGGVFHASAIDYKALQFWNSLRCGRIMLNEMIREQYFVGCASIPLFDTGMHYGWFQDAKNNIDDIISEVVGSIPQFSTGMPSTCSTSTPPISISNSTYLPSSDYSDRKFTYSEEAGAYSVIYPLYLIGRSPEGPLDLRQWAIGRLQYIGRVVGLSDAIMVADLLEQKIDVDPWVVCASMGCYNAPI